MAEFALHTPTEAEVHDAVAAIEDVLRLDEIGEVDLPPYLSRLLLQLEEMLAEAPPHPERTSPALEGAAS